MTFLQNVGKDIKAVFHWIGSPKVQAAIVVAEDAAEVLDPGIAPFMAITQRWQTEIFKSEAIAAAAASQNGTGTQKAAAVITALTPEVLAFTQAHGYVDLTPAQMQAANTLLAQFANLFVAKAPATATPAAPVA